MNINPMLENNNQFLINNNNTNILRQMNNINNIEDYTISQHQTNSLGLNVAPAPVEHTFNNKQYMSYNYDMSSAGLVGLQQTPLASKLTTITSNNDSENKSFSLDLLGVNGHAGNFNKKTKKSKDESKRILRVESLS